MPPGGRWTWALDLARYHYPLPAGPCRLVAHYAYAPADVRLASDPVDLTIEPAALRDLVLLEDAPVLDTLALLLRAGQPAAPEADPHRIQYFRVGINA